MGKSDRHTDRHTDEFEKRKKDTSEAAGDRTGQAPGGSREGGARSRKGPGRGEEDWKVHPREDSPAEWDEEDRPNT